MKLFLEGLDRPGLNTLKVYEEAGGYESLRKAMKMEAADVLAELQACLLYTSPSPRDRS